jgi:hypothetical protein
MDDNERLGAIRGREFRDFLNYCWLLKMKSALWSLMVHVAQKETRYE